MKFQNEVAWMCTGLCQVVMGPLLTTRHPDWILGADYFATVALSWPRRLRMAKQAVPFDSEWLPQITGAFLHSLSVTSTTRL